MTTYSFEIAVFTLVEGVAQTGGIVSGEVEADRYSSACVNAWPLINNECKRIAEETGCRTAVGNLHVEHPS